MPSGCPHPPRGWGLPRGPLAPSSVCCRCCHWMFWPCCSSSWTSSLPGWLCPPSCQTTSLRGNLGEEERHPQQTGFLGEERRSGSSNWNWCLTSLPPPHCGPQAPLGTPEFLRVILHLVLVPPTLPCQTKLPESREPTTSSSYFFSILCLSTSPEGKQTVKLKANPPCLLPHSDSLVSLPFNTWLAQRN